MIHRPLPHNKRYNPTYIIKEEIETVKVIILNFH